MGKDREDRRRIDRRKRTEGGWREECNTDGQNWRNEEGGNMKMLTSRTVFVAVED